MGTSWERGKVFLSPLPSCLGPLPFYYSDPSLEGSVKLKFKALPFFSPHQRQRPDNCHSRDHTQALMTAGMGHHRGQLYGGRTPQEAHTRVDTAE